MPGCAASSSSAPAPDGCSDAVVIYNQAVRDNADFRAGALTVGDITVRLDKTQSDFSALAGRVESPELRQHLVDLARGVGLYRIGAVNGDLPKRDEGSALIGQAGQEMQTLCRLTRTGS